MVSCFGFGGDGKSAAALLLPIAQASVRWPISCRFSTTDATPSAGGATDCAVSEKLAHALYRMTEYRGCHLRLDDPSGCPHFVLLTARLPYVPWLPSYSVYNLSD